MLGIAQVLLKRQLSRLIFSNSQARDCKRNARPPRGKMPIRQPVDDFGINRPWSLLPLMNSFELLESIR
jgi:hypothetical protein